MAKNTNSNKGILEKAFRNALTLTLDKVDDAVVDDVLNSFSAPGTAARFAFVACLPWERATRHYEKMSGLARDESLRLRFNTWWEDGQPDFPLAMRHEWLKAIHGSDGSLPASWFSSMDGLDMLATRRGNPPQLPSFTAFMASRVMEEKAAGGTGKSPWHQLTFDWFKMVMQESMQRPTTISSSMREGLTNLYVALFEFPVISGLVLSLPEDTQLQLHSSAESARLYSRLPSENPPAARISI